MPPSSQQIRYLRITHQVKENKEWRKVYVWGIDAYDKYGRWGPPPTPSLHPLTLKAMMGVNGIWGVHGAADDPLEQPCFTCGLGEDLALKLAADVGLNLQNYIMYDK
ncbi:hypothetical protein GPECTOR_21g709 [Gonium pectorale]|uniref:Uncharacterized protein n=1 Tax=Gonium pectorale TaxID=33097 RepID=A0A150GI54_GONPE|nr:hypothetical protein GPECTOR_21g709 [Gonium pectorale]|eukprot:KXZ49483.1 hypothetical protein GPECTOR_21g709 [Gonium pectorale]